MESKSLTDELWREYEFLESPGEEESIYRVYRIENPVQLYIGNTTHRVVDLEGIVHCVPAPGTKGCVLRWSPKDIYNPVQF